MGTTTLTPEETAVAAGLVGASLTMMLLFIITFMVLLVIARWQVFKKAGEQGWKSIIPIYSDYVQWRIAWNKISLFWVAIALLILGSILASLDGTIVTTASGRVVATGNYGILGIIGLCCMCATGVLHLVSAYKLFASFGHGAGWLIGYLFVPNIIMLVLGFGSSYYRGPRD